MWSEDQDLFFYPFRFLIATALFMDSLKYNIDSFVKNQLWTLFPDTILFIYMSFSKVISHSLN